MREYIDNYEYARKHLENRFLPIPIDDEKLMLERYKRLIDPADSSNLIIKDGFTRNHPDLPITVDFKNISYWQALDKVAELSGNMHGDDPSWTGG